VHQELDAHRLSHIGRHIHCLVGIVRSITQMVDRLQDRTTAIGDVSILPVERYAVISAVLVPEAQRSAGRHWPELLIEGAVSQRLVTVLLAMGICLWVAACKCGMGSGVWAVGPDYRIVDVAVNDPGREAACLESTVLDEPGVADGSHIIVHPGEGRIRIAAIIGNVPGVNTRRQRA